MCDDPNFWESRPLSNVMVQYAAADVLSLPLAFRQLWVLLGTSSRAKIWSLSQVYVTQLRDAEDDVIQMRRNQERNRNGSSEEGGTSSVITGTGVTGVTVQSGSVEAQTESSEKKMSSPTSTDRTSVGHGRVTIAAAVTVSSTQTQTQTPAAVVVCDATPPAAKRRKVDTTNDTKPPTEVFVPTYGIAEVRGSV